jgi:hypothetical protein
MKILVFEDMLERKKHFAKNLIGANVDYSEDALEAKLMIAKNRYEVIFLDHDMNLETNTSSTYDGNNGYSVACFIKEHPEFAPKVVIVHSCNAPGGDAIMFVLRDSIDELHRIPFAWTKITVNGNKLVVK